MYGNQVPDTSIFETSIQESTDYNDMLFRILIVISLLVRIINGILWIKILYRTIKSNNKINNIFYLFLDIVLFSSSIIMAKLSKPLSVLPDEGVMQEIDYEYAILYSLFAILIPSINIIILNHMNKKMKNCEEKEEK